MLKVLGTLFFGIFAAVFGCLFLISWQHYDITRFLPPGSGRYVVTTFDHMLGLAALTLVCGAFFLGSLASLFSSADEQEGEPSNAEAKSAEGPSWKCPGCGEDNPGNFEECWKCQRWRPGREKS